MPPGRSEPIDSSCLHRLLLWSVQASRTTSTSCGSPLEDDQVVRRCLLTISAFCSRLRGVWSSCSLPCSAPSAPFRCAPDVVLAGYARSCADTIMWASFVHALRGSGARVSARLWSTGNWIPCLLQAWFEIGYQLVYWEMTSGNCLRIPVNLRSLF